jgi:hypothetical protein
MQDESVPTTPLDELRRLLIARSTGYTPTERNLAFLTSNTFFSLWCYPNLYKEPGKELCDLLVLFGEDIILFSDKAIAYDSSANSDVAWQRWFRRAVLSSANQLYGAEAWIRRYPDRIFLDPKCQVRMPLALAHTSKIRFHRVAIANGSRSACQLRGLRRGSFKIASDLIGEDHLNTPCSIGRIRADKPIVHVMDSLSLEIVLRELDTMMDFISYLLQKETLLESGHKIHVVGEEQLLALYIEKSYNFGTAGDIALSRDNRYEHLTTTKTYMTRKRANEVSYLFDRFIEEVIWRAEPRALDLELDVSAEQLEQALRIIAQERRFKRRLLGEVFVSLRSGNWDRPTGRLAYLKEEPEIVYVFTTVPRRSTQTTVERGKITQAFLYGYCFRVPLVVPEAKHIVGIYIGDPGSGVGGAMCYMNAGDPAFVEMVKKFEEDTPFLGLVRTTEQKVNQHTSFKDPGPSILEVNRKIS